MTRTNAMGLFRSSGVVLALMASACAGPQSSSLTSPSEVLDANFSGSPQAVVDHTLPPDEVLPLSNNPCTDSGTTLNVHYLKYIDITTEDGTGNTHHHITAMVEVTSADGYSGRAMYIVQDNGENFPIFDEEFSVFSVNMVNATGQRMIVQLLNHLVFKDGEFLVLIDVDRATCVGKPSV